MDLELLLAEYARLRQELQAAYAAPSWKAARIDLIAEQLARTEREIARLQPADEQTGDTFPAFGFTK